MSLRRLMALFMLTLLLPIERIAVADQQALISENFSLELRIERLRGMPASASRSHELAAALLEARRHDEAEHLLREALAGNKSGADDSLARARLENLLGQVLAATGKPAAAAVLFSNARRAAGGDPALGVSAAINLSRVSAVETRLSLLSEAYGLCATLTDERQRARLLAAIGSQAQQFGRSGRDLASQALREGQTLAKRSDDWRVLATIEDALSQWYADNGRRREALQSIDAGVIAAGRIDAHDLLMTLEWRRGRLLREAGEASAAIDAYQRAVDHLESVRQDIPVTYDNGRSSFRETLSPIYLGLADLLLEVGLGREGDEEQARLRRARDVVELIKQSELQDFLGDRCSVEAVRRNSSRPVPSGVAIYYPVILPERVEILVETRQGLFRARTSISAAKLRDEALGFASAVRNNDDYLVQGRRLYDWLIRPVADELKRRDVHTLVTIPDGALRLIPFAALNDGQSHLIETLSIATTPGMSLTADSKATDPRGFTTLLAGLAEPGPVVEKLPGATTMETARVSTPAPSRDIATRSVKPVEDSVRGEAAGVSRYAALRKRYALPGVRDEIQTLSGQLANVALVDAQFTLSELGRNVTAGGHRIVHIASHGFFGGSAEESFIMTYDEILTISGLQDLLQREAASNAPIDLLTLSACQTAEGYDRSPLGISGAALKARARSALGTLWPVSDDAARDLMPKFYRGMIQEGRSKAQALRRAQTDILADPRYAHPFFWAPFVLVGDWQ